MKKRRIILMWSVSLLLLASCGGNQRGADAPDAQTGKDEVKNERTDQEDAGAGDDSASDDAGDSGSGAAGDSSGAASDSTAGDGAGGAGGAGSPDGWKQAYLGWLDESEYADMCTYSLIYVDEDEIPELVSNTGVEAGGCQILTWHDGTLDVLQTSRLYFSYIEKANLLCNSEGNMGYYYDDIYTIKDGRWQFLCGGTYHDPETGPQLDENENDYIYEYEWQEEPVEEAEYEQRFHAVYQEDQAVTPGTYYIRDELSSILATGETISANHRYELIIGDLTWSEAKQACEEKGGYLATLTSQEEFHRVQEQIIAEGHTSVTFFVGAANKEDMFGYTWLEPGTEKGYGMLQLYSALFEGYWLEEEPSYTGIAEDGQEVTEDCVALIYRSSEGRCYLNDVADDILSEAPSFAGRVGYICEYDE